MLKKEDGVIDWQRPARVSHNQVRGLDPWPGTYTSLDGDILKIAATTVRDATGEPGTILAADKNGVLVACGEGSLLIGELQLPGKKRLAAVNFLSGRPLFIGTQLPS
jgi:methionyl-tRNA formyltransferase